MKQIALNNKQYKLLLEIIYMEKKRKTTHYNILQNPNHKKKLLEEISNISDLMKAVK